MMTCQYCQGPCIKKGFQKGKQKYRCRSCRKYQLSAYQYHMCSSREEDQVIRLNRIGVGISGIARFTGMSKAHVINKIRQLAARTARPCINESQQDYEVDELRTYIGRKENSCYIIYAINRHTRRVIDFVAGARNRKNIDRVIATLRKLRPGRIYTDKLNIYPGLIDRSVHEAGAYKINRIERHNLTLRTHLKRLARKTICFSRSVQALEDCLKIYLWC